MRTSTRKRLAWLVLAAVAFIPAACSKRAAWEEKNERIVAERSLPVRVRRDVPRSKLVSNLEPGVVASLAKIPATELGPGIRGRLYWGKGVLVAWLKLEAGAATVEEPLPADRLMLVTRGSVEQLVGGAYVPMICLGREAPDGVHGGTPRNDFIYLPKGTPSAFRTGSFGAEVIEVYSPPRLDYLKKAGAQKLPSSVPEGRFPVPPSVEPGKIHDLRDLQPTELSPGANSRLIGMPGAQLSFLQMNPGSVFDLHLHPEEQLMAVLRGSIEEKILDGSAMMKRSDLLLIPGNMVHGGANGPRGCDVLDVFWPPRPDYAEKMAARLAAFHAVVPEDARVELVVDGARSGPGLVFTEGPAWLGGRLYFSSLGFDAAWNGDPGRSAVVEMDPDGSYRYVTSGRMLTNGIKPLPNGNLAVCDMFGHRIVEMTTAGRVVRTIVARYGGKPIDGPNDLVFDARGGLYFTDPQFTAEPVKSQPGKAVYYLNPKGEVLRVIEPGAYGMPNGVALSPDGQTLYVNNTFDDAGRDTDKDNFVWAYDVRDDGTLGNERKFAELVLTPDVLDAGTKSTSADGMAVDDAGNLYVCTYAGLQIFNPRGGFIGIVNFPVFPVNCAFGDADRQTLYVTAYNKIYKIRTKVKGLEPLYR